MSKLSQFFVLIMGVVFITPQQGSAGIIGVYSNRTIFQSVVNVTGTENFNSFVNDASFHEVSLDVGDFSLLAVGNSLDPVRRNKIDVPPFEFGSFNIDGSTIANISLDLGGSLRLTFDQAITAFGADFAHLNNDFIRTQIVVENDSLSPAVAAITSPRFFGFISNTPFTEIEFRGVGAGGDGFGMDNVTYGEHDCPAHAAVPAPSSIVGFATLGLVVTVSRRRGRATGRRSTAH